MSGRLGSLVPETPALSVREAGRRGGMTTSRRHGHEFYEAIGRKGGSTVAARYGHEHFLEIGHKGGNVSRRRAELAARMADQAARVLGENPSIERTPAGAALRQTLQALRDLA